MSVLIAGVLCAGCGKVSGDAIGAGDDGNDVGGTGADREFDTCKIQFLMQKVL